MADSSFYITLPSNACTSVFPQNTASAFTICLARPLELSGAWDVGLAEVQYPHSWNTLSQDATYGIVSQEKHWGFKVPRSYYSSIPDLIEEMNSVAQSHRHPPDLRLDYDPVIRKVLLKAPPTYTFSASTELPHILGVLPHVAVQKMPFTADITGGFNTLYIYTDIVDHQIVGDAYVPLLRCIPVQGKAGDCINNIYDKPHYIPLNKHHIDTITIEIKADQNKNVPFRFGKVIVKLHFRTRKGLIF